MTEKLCKNCVSFKPVDASDPDSDGECRFNPPYVVRWQGQGDNADNFPRSLWPRVKSSDRCTNGWLEKEPDPSKNESQRDQGPQQTQADTNYKSLE